MEEAAKLKQACKGATVPVPLPVSWLFFKHAILERPQALVKKEANPANKWGPSFCRKGRGRSERTVRRMTSDMLATVWRYYEALLHPASPVYVAESSSVPVGWGCLPNTHSGWRLALASAHLFGLCFGVAEEQFTVLESVKYPSLYWNDAMLSILYRPLSLVNHECGSPLCFLFPRKVDAQQRQGGVRLEEFDGLSAIYARLIEEGCRLKKDQEITIDYFNSGSDDVSQDKTRSPVQTFLVLDAGVAHVAKTRTTDAI